MKITVTFEESQQLGVMEIKIKNHRLH